MPRPASRRVMFDVVPWPTPTRATTDATPMMTPSIVSAARSRLVRSRDRAGGAARPTLMRRSARRGGGPGGRPAAATSGVVGDEHDRPAGGVELAEEAEDVGADVAVEVAGRLVGEDERRVGDERPGDGDPLLLAAGQLGRLVVEAVAQPEPLEGGRGAGDPLARDRRPGTAAAWRRCRGPRSAAAGCTTGRRTRSSGCGAGRARRRRARRPASRPAGTRPRSAGRGSRGCSSSCSCRSPTARRSRRTRRADVEADVVEGGHLHPAHVVDAADAVERDDRGGHGWRPARPPRAGAAAGRCRDGDATIAEPAGAAGRLVRCVRRPCRDDGRRPRSARDLISAVVLVTRPTWTGWRAGCRPRRVS